MSTHPPRQADHGVSLLELLISLAILAMLTIAITSIFGLGRRVWDASDRFEGRIEVAIVRDRLRHALEHMPVPNANLSGADVFVGSKDQFRFLISGHALGKSDARNYWVGVETNQTSSSRTLQAFEGPVGEEASDHRVIATGFTDVVISYYGSKTSSAAPGWYDEWSDSRLLPKLVKISFVTGANRPIPPFAVQPAKVTRQRLISLSSLVPPG